MYTSLSHVTFLWLWGFILKIPQCLQALWDDILWLQGVFLNNIITILIDLSVQLAIYSINRTEGGLHIVAVRIGYLMHMRIYKD